MKYNCKNQTETNENGNLIHFNHNFPNFFPENASSIDYQSEGD